MTQEEWYAQLNDRTRRYADRVLDPDRRVHVHGEDAYLGTYAGQVALLTLTNLLARMTPSITLDVPNVPIVAPLPWRGRSLRDYALEVMSSADPCGKFEHSSVEGSGYTLSIGPSAAEHCIHGSGWDAYIGSQSSPLDSANELNPFGPALAAILAAAHLFATKFGSFPPGRVLNALNWSPERARPDVCLPLDGQLGELWVVGAGSVSTAFLYFTTLWNRSFDGTIFDGDVVKILNLSRSPIFLARDCGLPKATVSARYLEYVGVENVRHEDYYLHESAIWNGREEGTPDLIFAGANEHNVRYQIEAEFPPLQIYGTTGKNWQASLVRHVPFCDPCSNCLFPEQASLGSTMCASGEVENSKGDVVDAALPFLSFAAGLMSAAEVAKLTLPEYPFSANRVFLYTRDGDFRLAHAPIQRSDRCLCRHRSAEVHRAMIAGTRFQQLSD